MTEAMLSTLPASGPDSSAISNGVTANYRSCDPSSSRLPEGCILDKLLRLQKQSEMDEREAQALRDRLLARVKTTAEQLHQVPGHDGPFGTPAYSFCRNEKSHLSKRLNELKHNGTKEKAPFSGTVFNTLSPGVIGFVASVSSKNHLLTG